MLHMVGHCIPVLDEKLEAWDDLPDSGHALTRECLLDIGWLLDNVSNGQI